MRKQIAAANWKMNLTISEAEILLDQLLTSDFSLSSHQEAIFAIPSLYIPLATQKLAGNNNVFVAAQNCHFKIQWSLYWRNLCSYVCFGWGKAYCIRTF